MKFTKTLGMFLLAVGLVIIGWDLYSSYNIFTGKMVVPGIFSGPEEETLIQPEQMTVEQIIETQLRKAFPIDADVLPEMLNLIT